MHIVTIIAFALLFLHAEQSGRWMLVANDDIFITFSAICATPLFLGGVTWAFSERARRALVAVDANVARIQRGYHRFTFWLRIVLLGCFAATVFLTRWPLWLHFEDVSPVIQSMSNLVILLPFVSSTLLIWVAEYPMESALRQRVLTTFSTESGNGSDRWSLRTYLDFNVRHQLLIVAVPLTAILFFAELTRHYEQELRQATGWVWAPDCLLGASAFGVFLLAPVILIKVWHTSTLPAGVMRQQLEALGARVKLRYRDILIWKSDGMMINAAVMGIWSRVRYVLLSDALLANMSAKQIEAVFGHEAGHVRHRHIQYFLIFALVGWLSVSALMEALASLALTGRTVWLSLSVIQGVGMVSTVAYWTIGFGWVSRRFERQADFFGARCAAPLPTECKLPCSVHGEDGLESSDTRRVCATGAAMFASALERVAMLNGVSPEERSWRHASIASRIRFLDSAANDPACAVRFENLVSRVKIVMLTIAIVGSVAWVYYGLTCQPAILRL